MKCVHIGLNQVTLIEWGNLWHKGVQYRPDAKVLGVFSQIGELYNVHHNVVI